MNNERNEKTCAELVEAKAHERLADLRVLLNGEEIEKGYDAAACLSEYGLWFHYELDPNARDYFCFLLTTGGPHEEIRFYLDGNQWADTITFHYEDWFDGACHYLKDKDLNTARDWLEWFKNNPRRFLGPDSPESTYTLNQFKQKAQREAAIPIGTQYNG